MDAFSACSSRTVSVREAFLSFLSAFSFRHSLSASLGSLGSSCLGFRCQKLTLWAPHYHRPQCLPHRDMGHIPMASPFGVPLQMGRHQAKSFKNASPKKTYLSWYTLVSFVDGYCLFLVTRPPYQAYWPQLVLITAIYYFSRAVSLASARVVSLIT